MSKGWFNSDQPLWLPKGSVRAIIALSCIWSAIYAGLVLGDLVEGGILFVFGMSVVKDYFKDRANGAI